MRAVFRTAAKFRPASGQAYSSICLTSEVRASGWEKLGLTVLAVAAAAKLIDSVDAAPARAPPKPEPTFEVVCGYVADALASCVHSALTYRVARAVSGFQLCATRFAASAV